MKKVKWLIAICLPFFLGFTNIILIANPVFLRWEYLKPTFPPDRYGLSSGQRVELATVAVEFLNSWEPPEKAIHLLTEQTLEGKPLYKQRELDHMVDTKVRTDLIRLAAIGTGVIVVGGTLLLAIKPATRAAAWSGLFNGSVLTAGILGAISAYILIGWRSFFTRFHELLFPPGTWTFAYSDSLIRLFPEKFWFDIGVILGVGTLVQALLVGSIAYWLGLQKRDG